MSAPYYEDDLVTLYLGDCRDVDAWKTADVLITEPPYGIKWAQATYEFRDGGRPYSTREHAGIAGDDSTALLDGVLDLFGDRPQAVFGSPFLSAPVGTRQVLVWKKPLNSGLWGTVAGFRRDIEMIYLLGKWPKRRPQSSGVLEAGGSVSNAGTVGHPHAKPVPVLAALIGASEKGTVADPFAGSGSTLVAARLLGRKAIGIEIDERYCEAAARRLSQGVLDFGQWDA